MKHKTIEIQQKVVSQTAWQFRDTTFYIILLISCLVT